MKLLEQHLESLLAELCEYENLEDNLRKLVHSMDDVFEFQSMGIYLKDPISNQFKFKTGRHLSQYFMQSVDYGMGDDIIQELYQGKIVQCKENKKYKFEFDYVDLIVVPLVYRCDFQGFMFMDASEIPFNEEEITMYQMYAHLCSLLIRIFSQEHALVLSSLEIDPVTHLYVLDAFLKHGSRLFDQMQRYHHELHYVAVTIHDFSDLVQNMGKEKGRELRHKVGTTLISQLRKSDLIGDSGPDSGAILLPETPTEHVLLVVNRLNDMISSFPELKQHKVCWGIARMTKSSMTISDLKFKAESALQNGVKTSSECIFIEKDRELL
ncbi:MAG TPA: diguanylate cyclase [Candidatus Cloacimonadota bacterium]|nr:diguanylate cyclase [Candidatus Cloacimonadota bacterium]HPT71668.1 diguanylate cyclase [Candidatus Cloacimonadota bacterium]